METENTVKENKKISQIYIKLDDDTSEVADIAVHANNVIDLEKVLQESGAVGIKWTTIENQGQES